MTHRPTEDDIEVTTVMAVMPVSFYSANKKAYFWPEQNRCPICLAGKFKHIEHTGILTCKVCRFELHVPFIA